MEGVIDLPAYAMGADSIPACQKHPSTKIATLALVKAISGRTSTAWQIEAKNPAESQTSQMEFGAQHLLHLGVDAAVGQHRGPSAGAARSGLNWHGDTATLRLSPTAVSLVTAG